MAFCVLQDSWCNVDDAWFLRLDEIQTVLVELLPELVQIGLEALDPAWNGIISPGIDDECRPRGWCLC
jgi:hypothetical protein